jgi:hypothetical protein
MAKDLSRHQQGIIKRYYEHQETIQSQKLSEIVSDLWLAEDEKAKTKLWGKAQLALMRVGVDATRVAAVVAKRDFEGLAKLVAQVDAGSAPKAVPGSEQAAPAPAPGSAPGSTGEPPRTPVINDTRSVRQMIADHAAEGGYDSLEEPNLKRAVKAFRRKLKSMKRDDESRLGNRYVTAGRSSDISAITPPREFPAPVWEKLVQLGRLKRAGQGTYTLP